MNGHLRVLHLEGEYRSRVEAVGETAATKEFAIALVRAEQEVEYLLHKLAQLDKKEKA
jgi:hypothetical protein